MAQGRAHHSIAAAAGGCAHLDSHRPSPLWAGVTVLYGGNLPVLIQSKELVG